MSHLAFLTCSDIDTGDNTTGNLRRLCLFCFCMGSFLEACYSLLFLCAVKRKRRLKISSGHWSLPVSLSVSYTSVIACFIYLQTFVKCTHVDHIVFWKCTLWSFLNIFFCKLIDFSFSLTDHNCDLPSLCIFLSLSNFYSFLCIFLIRSAAL